MELPQREKGSIAARLAVLRMGLIGITAVFSAALIAATAVVYSGVAEANSEVDAGYSFGDYLGDVGPVIGLALFILILTAVIINFGYSYYLKNQADE
jgi:hypothetical protein